MRNDNGNDVNVPLHKQDPSRYRYLLLLKFILVNVTAVSFCAIAFIQGWIEQFFGKVDESWADIFFTFDVRSTSIAIITLVFLIGWLLAFWHTIVISREINNVKLRHPPPYSRVAEHLARTRGVGAASRINFLGFLSMKMASRTAAVHFFSSILTLLGLTGTVLGFIIALSGVNPDVVGDVDLIGPMMATLIKGMGVALYTTLAGALLGGVWLSIIVHLIRNSFQTFLALLGERAEYEAMYEERKTPAGEAEKSPRYDAGGNEA